VQLLRAVGHAAETIGSMSWQILWALVFGFYLSATVEALVRKDTIARLLGDRRPRNVAIAAGLGLPRRHAATRPSRWPVHWSARVPTSSPPWRSRSPRRTW
jgi:hypothetical protein